MYLNGGSTLPSVIELRHKAVLVNSSILLGLAIELWQGQTLVILAVSAVLLFSAANLVLLRAAREERRKPSRVSVRASLVKSRIVGQQHSESEISQLQ